LELSFTAHMPLLMAASAVGLGKRRSSMVLPALSTYHQKLIVLK